VGEGEGGNEARRETAEGSEDARWVHGEFALRVGKVLVSSYVT
jgi:hypothetical protein